MSLSKIHKPEEIFKLEISTYHPIFEGFALEPAPSLIGRSSLEEDITPGFDPINKFRKWKVPLLSDVWQAPKVIGRVAPFNDYPCINLIYPAFSKRACEGLHEFLEPNGELLPLAGGFRGCGAGNNDTVVVYLYAVAAPYGRTFLWKGSRLQ